MLRYISAAIVAGDSPTTQQGAEIRVKLGLERPIAQQFAIWVSGAVRGDFGESFFFKKQVAELIRERLEPTAALALCTIVLAVAVAVPLGVIAAARRGTWIDRAVMGFSVLGFSVSVFVIGYLLIYLFAIQLAWLPVQGYQRLAKGSGGFLQRLILPSVTLAVLYVALVARITRNRVLEVLGADHVRTARAKGSATARCSCATSSGRLPCPSSLSSASVWRCSSVVWSSPSPPTASRASAG